MKCQYTQPEMYKAVKQAHVILLYVAWYDGYAKVTRKEAKRIIANCSKEATFDYRIDKGFLWIDYSDNAG